MQIRRIEAAIVQRTHIRIVQAAGRVDPFAPEGACHRLFVVFRDLVEPRIESDLDGVLTQQSRAERVNRAKKRAFEIAQRCDAACVRFGVSPGIANDRLELQLESLAQFVRSFPRERDCRELLNRSAGDDVPQQSRHQRRRLARACTSFHQQVGSEVMLDAGARLLVWRRGCHSLSSASPPPRRASIDAYSGSDSAFALAQAARGDDARNSLGCTRQIGA